MKHKRMTFSVTVFIVLTLAAFLGLVTGATISMFWIV